MPSQQYHDGRSMEENPVLHALLIETLKLDRIDTLGGGHTGTKGDTFGTVGDQRFPISVKYTGTQNTQVHLTTLEKFRNELSMPQDIFDRMEKFFGIIDTQRFLSWFTTAPTEFEMHNKRMVSGHIDNWPTVLDWMNTKRREIAELCIKSIDGENPVRYLTWINKKNNKVTILDVETLIDFIATECTWEDGPRGGTTIRCVYTVTNDKGKVKKKPIFSCQMKGSGGKNGEKDHCPQFHIHTNWPKPAVLHSNLVLQ